MRTLVYFCNAIIKKALKELKASSSKVLQGKDERIAEAVRKLNGLGSQISETTNTASTELPHLSSIQVASAPSSSAEQLLKQSQNYYQEIITTQYHMLMEGLGTASRKDFAKVLSSVPIHADNTLGQSIDQQLQAGKTNEEVIVHTKQQISYIVNKALYAIYNNK